jgi:serine/threonine protein kinase
VHHDLKSSNILITRNGQNVKLIDFGLSNTDSTSDNNNSSTDIQLFANILTLLFPNRYCHIARACQQSKYANIAALKQAFHRRHIWQKSLPYIVSLICVVVCSIVLLRSRTQQLREQAILDIVNHHVEIKINELQCSADTIPTYLEFSQKHYGIIWREATIIRDSIANLYADDPVMRQKCLQSWTTSFGERFIQFDAQVKQSKSQP